MISSLDNFDCGEPSPFATIDDSMIVCKAGPWSTSKLPCELEGIWLLTIVATIEPSSTVAHRTIVYFEMTRVRTHNTINVIPIHAAILTIRSWFSSEMITCRLRTLLHGRTILTLSFWCRSSPSFPSTLDMLIFASCCPSEKVQSMNRFHSISHRRGTFGMAASLLQD